MATATWSHAKPDETISKIKDPVEMTDCTVSLKKQSESGRHCVTFNSGMVLLKRCDNTTCYVNKGKVTKDAIPFCTDTGGTNPSFSIQNTAFRKVNYTELSKDSNAGKCNINGLEILRLMVKEELGYSQIQAMRDTDDFQISKGFQKIYSMLKEACAAQKMSSIGAGYLIFFSAKDEQIISLASGGKEVSIKTALRECF
jgi:hypothetical protein